MMDFLLSVDNHNRLIQFAETFPYLVGKGYASVLTAGTAYGNDQMILSFLDVTGNKVAGKTDDTACEVFGQL